ncbi:hypothetical protein C8Q78DRAFT_762835 [Trametes maxima]|nr:hypothetical protein C8Q78DRAFT_762835 [Trametes maxima]
MSQYSLSTCDPLQRKKADRKDVRRAPHIGAFVSTVLFEMGTMDTFFPGSRAGTISLLEDISEVGAEDYNSFKPILRSPRGSSSDIDVANSSLTAARKKSSSVATVFGGPVLESPCSSRASTMDESAALLVGGTTYSASPSSSPRTLNQPAKKRPSPLQPAETVEMSQSADAEAVTPTAPTPTTPSAFARAFGAMIKSRFL